MGGITTSNMNQLDINSANRNGGLVPGRSSTWSWTTNYGAVSRIGMEAGAGGVFLVYRVKGQAGEWLECRYWVAVQWSPCNYGGNRPWWTCPGCGRRVAVLFGGDRFACRHCHDLAYKSTRTAKSSRCYDRANKIRQRLGWGGGIASPPGTKPKGMHWKTYLRLLRRLNAHATDSDKITGKLVARLQKRLADG